MTCIAYHHNDKEIAVDSRATGGNIILSDKVDKVVKNDIGIWILCGSICDCKDFVMLKKNDNIEILPDCTALLIKDNSVFYVMVNNEGYCCYTELSYDFTLGSGSEYATGAMDHGKSARDAVKYAMTRDPYTGGRVHVFQVK